MSNVTLSKQEIISLYNQSTNEGKRALENKLGKEYFDFDPVKNIHSLLDACQYTGADSDTAQPFKSPVNDDQRCINAFAALIQINRAFNKNQKAQWGPGTPYKYYPWFEMPTPSGSALSVGVTVGGRTSTRVPARLTVLNQDHVKTLYERFTELYKDLMIDK